MRICDGCKKLYDCNYLFNRENGVLCYDCIEKGVILYSERVIKLEILRDSLNSLNPTIRAKIISEAKNKYNIYKDSHLDSNEISILKQISLK